MPRPSEREVHPFDELIMFIVSGSMALVAMVLYMGVFFYMHRRKPVPAEAT